MQKLIIYPYWILNYRSLVSCSCFSTTYNLSILDFKFLILSKMLSDLAAYNLSILDFKLIFRMFLPSRCFSYNLSILDFKSSR